MPPKEGKVVKKRNQRWRWCPPLFPSLQRHFPVGQRRTGVAAGRRKTWLPRWPVWGGNPDLSRTRSPAQKGLPSRWPLPLPLWWHLVGGRGQMCPDRWCLTLGAYHSSRVPAWLHRSVCHRSGRDQLVPAWKANGLQTLCKDDVVDISSIWHSLVGLQAI